MLTVYDFKLYPKDKGRLISELKRAFDAYDADKMENVEFLKLIGHYRECSEFKKWLGQEESSPPGEFKVDASTKKQLGVQRSNRLELILNTAPFLSDNEE